MTRPLSAGIITMLLSFISRFSACCPSFVKLFSGIDSDCTVKVQPKIFFRLNKLHDRASKGHGSIPGLTS